FKVRSKVVSAELEVMSVSAIERGGEFKGSKVVAVKLNVVFAVEIKGGSFKEDLKGSISVVSGRLRLAQLLFLECQRFLSLFSDRNLPNFFSISGIKFIQ